MQIIWPLIPAAVIKTNSMKVHLFLTMLLLFNLTRTIGQTIKRIDGTRISIDSLQSKIQYLMKVANVSGVAVSVYNNNRPVFSKTFGLANVKKNTPLEPTTVMYAASLSKAVFGYIAMQLVQEKVLDLDKPLVEYLDQPLHQYKMAKKYKGYQDLKNDERYKKITGRMCLSHTTGFPNWRWFEPDEKLRINFNPGSRYSYSGEGLYLLQFVIEKITGKDYETIAQERVFKPLRMSNSSQVWQKHFDQKFAYGHNGKGNPYYDIEKWDEAGVAGSLSTTPEDFTKFYTALIGRKGLTKKSFQEMTRLQIRIRSKRQFGPMAFEDGDQNDGIQLGYGLGVGVFQTPYGNAFFKEGGDEGWTHYSICFPDKKIAIFIMTNSDNGGSIFKELLAVAIGNRFTPWQWGNYIPYDYKN